MNDAFVWLFSSIWNAVNPDLSIILDNLHSLKCIQCKYDSALEFGPKKVSSILFSCRTCTVAWSGLVICKKSLARSLGLKEEIEEFALLFMVLMRMNLGIWMTTSKLMLKPPLRLWSEDAELSKATRSVVSSTYLNRFGSWFLKRTCVKQFLK